MLGRLIIDSIRPSTPTRYPAKAYVGERVTVTAAIFREGHDILAGRVKWRPAGVKEWASAPMAEVNHGLARWEGTIEPAAIGMHDLQIEAWTDHYATWRRDVEAKAGADPLDSLFAELEEGALIIERLMKRTPRQHRRALQAAIYGLRDDTISRDERLNAGLDDHIAAILKDVEDPADLTRSDRVPLWVDRERGQFGAWYELFPRSEGGLAGAVKRLPGVAEMGFDIVYLPPIHPIGTTARKGRNNTLLADDDDPGSPWAIGSELGGHTDIAPELGTIEDFDRFVEEAESNGLEVALDYALQCSPDHPWVKQHPEWFHHRPDGTIKYAENPPKKYQDIYPINFWPESDSDRKALWLACKGILDYWIDHGVGVFRVDNPHTKPFAFWEWIIPAVQADHPEVIFLAEAFTRPPVMAKLGEVGFTQSYTYFTWRTTREDLEEYVTELAHGPTADYMRPNFWPNTPDILAGPLRNGPPAAFALRFLLAATLVPSYGMYSGYELYENEPASETNEEYLYSEKYEIKRRDWSAPDALTPLITTVNEIRHRHPAFRELRTIHFHDTRHEQVIAYSKTSAGSAAEADDVVLCVVNIHQVDMAETTLALDLPAMGLGWNDTFDVIDELTGERFIWSGPNPYVKLDPAVRVGHVFSVHRRPIP